MVNKLSNIQINGTNYTISSLLLLCDEKLLDNNMQDWEREIYLFLLDWFSPSEIICVRTSGSTGTPKEVILRKEHMIASAKATVSFFKLEKNETVWLCLPVKYIAGKMFIVRAIVGELNLIFSKPDSMPLLEDKEIVAFTAMVPNQVYNLLNEESGVQQLKRVKRLLIGGSAISKELEELIFTTPGISAWQSYGMTETITHIAIRFISEKDNMKRYYPLPGIKLTSNTQNRLIIDAPAIGVSNLLTNDIVELFDDGSFIVKGRADNVIVSGGVKLYPEIIESKISHLIPNEFFIIGIRDGEYGRKLVLFIESEIMDDQWENKLRHHLKNELSKYEIPKQIIVLSKFVRTGSDKVARDNTLNMFLSSDNSNILSN